jgi:Bacterial SH3 domain
MASESDSGHDPDEMRLERELFDAPDSSSEAAERAGNASADTGADASDWIESFEEAAFGVDDSRASRTDLGDRSRAESRVARTKAAAFGDMPRAGRSRKRLVIVAALVVLFVAAAAVGAVALIGRDDGAKSSSGSATTTGSESSTITGSRAVAPTTIAPAAAPTGPPMSTPTHIPFTVRSTCGGRDCAVAVREGPSTGAKNVGSLNAGAVVQVSCSTHGESIEDRESGQRSDVWYRLADTAGYSSGVYLEGPTVPDCG